MGKENEGFEILKSDLTLNIVSSSDLLQITSGKMELPESDGTLNTRLFSEVILEVVVGRGMEPLQSDETLCTTFLSNLLTWVVIVDSIGGPNFKASL